MSRLIDISAPLGSGTPAWPGSPGARVEALLAIARGDDANATRLDLDVHCGTHVDAPRHFLAEGATIDEVGLDPFVGPAHVADATGADEISASILDDLTVPDGTERLLLRTRNSLDRAMSHQPFREEYVALTLDAAHWIVSRGIRLVGTDYLSVQRFRDPPDTHRVLLGGGTVILEGLDMLEAPPGPCELICLPLHLVGAEAAPARAVIRTSA